METTQQHQSFQQVPQNYRVLSSSSHSNYNGSQIGSQAVMEIFFFLQNDKVCAERRLEWMDVSPQPSHVGT